MEVAAYCFLRYRKDKKVYFTLERNKLTQYNSLNNVACDLRTQTPVLTKCGKVTPP